MQLFLFVKAMSPFYQRCHHYVLALVLLDRLHVWSQPDGLSILWKSLQDDIREKSNQSSTHNVS